jgi:hypothetical protein
LNLEDYWLDGVRSNDIVSETKIEP